MINLINKPILVGEKMILRPFQPDEDFPYIEDSYLAINPYIKEDLDVFEAIACLRWLHLYQVAEGLPMEDHTVDRVNDFIKSSEHLPEDLLVAQ